MKIDSVFDVLEVGETAIVIFTRNRHLHLDANGAGLTGKWVIDPRGAYDRVVIYNRDDTSDTGGDVIVADYVGTSTTEEPGRFAVHFQDADCRGRTHRNWKEFAHTGQNPVRYIRTAELADEAAQPPAGR